MSINSLNTLTLIATNAMMAFTLSAHALADECTERAKQDLADGKKIIARCDGGLVRCEEGGNAIGNNMAYKLSNPAIKFDSENSIITIRIKSSYQRCVFTREPNSYGKGGTVALISVNPFSVHEYPFVVSGKVTRLKSRMTALQLMATDASGDASFYVVDTKTLKKDGASVSGNSLTFELKISINQVMSKSEIEKLASGQDVDFSLAIGSLGQGTNTEGFSAGGSYLLSATITKSRNAKENVKNIKFNQQ
jgi:hypothetical protein